MSCATMPDIGEKIPTARLTLARGDSWEALAKFTLVSVTGDPVDLSDDTLSATVSKDVGGTSIFSPTINISDPTSGQALIYISADQSLLLTPGVYANDSAGQYWLVVRMITPDDQRTTLFRAIICCIPGVSS